MLLSLTVDSHDCQVHRSRDVGEGDCSRHLASVSADRRTSSHTYVGTPDYVDTDIHT